MLGKPDAGTMNSSSPPRTGVSAAGALAGRAQSNASSRIPDLTMAGVRIISCLLIGLAVGQGHCFSARSAAANGRPNNTPGATSGVLGERCGSCVAPEPKRTVRKR